MQSFKLSHSACQRNVAKAPHKWWARLATGGLVEAGFAGSAAVCQNFGNPDLAWHPDMEAPELGAGDAGGELGSSASAFGQEGGLLFVSGRAGHKNADFRRSPAGTPKIFQH